MHARVNTYGKIFLLTNVASVMVGWLQYLVSNVWMPLRFTNAASEMLDWLQ